MQTNDVYLQTIFSYDQNYKKKLKSSIPGFLRACQVEYSPRSPDYVFSTENSRYMYSKYHGKVKGFKNRVKWLKMAIKKNFLKKNDTNFKTAS